MKNITRKTRRPNGEVVFITQTDIGVVKDG